MNYRRKIKCLRLALVANGLLKRNNFNLKSLLKRIFLLPFWYTLTLVSSLLDVLLLGEVLTTVLRITSRTKRRLTAEEVDRLVILTLEDRAYLSSITVLEHSWLARLGCWLLRRSSLGLGIARTVHFSRKIDSDKQLDRGWLVHELAHSLQYKYRGLVYIPEALIAQFFSGYDFGGKRSLDEQSRLDAFNPEQQAEVFRYLILTHYESPLLREIKEGKW